MGEGGRPVKLVHSSLLTVCNEGVREKFCCGLDGCSAKFVKKGHLRNHIKRVHGGSTSEKLGDPLKLSPPSERDFKFRNKKNSEQFQKVTCEQCGMVMCKGSLKKHMTTNHTGNEDRPYRCDARNCGARYVKSWLLKRHTKLFHKESGRGIKRIKSLILNHCCKIEGCDATFATSIYLKRHIQMFHDGKEKCDIRCK